MIQLANPETIPEVIQKWEESNFKGSKARLPQPKGTPTACIGFAKHVPNDIEHTQLISDVNKHFPDATCERLVKGGKSLNTVKITFQSSENLEKAVNNGILLESLSYSVKVEMPVPTIRYTQCFKCWKYRHVAKLCESTAEYCKLCSNVKHEGECQSTLKCRNCHEAHASDDRQKCPTFTQYKQYLQSKIHTTSR